MFYSGAAVGCFRAFPYLDAFLSRGSRSATFASKIYARSLRAMRIGGFWSARAHL
jgi:hypothetical protein